MIGAIVLAAGMSKRMGVPKQILPFKDTSLLFYVVDKVLKSKVDLVVLVLGFKGEKVAPMFSGLPVKIVYNEDFALGLSTSLKKGLMTFIEEARGIASKDRLGAIFVLGDQPGIEPIVINKLIGRFEQGGEIVAPFFNNKRGNPVLFSQTYFPALLEIEGDQGAKEILKNFRGEIVAVEITDEGILLDIDTPEDYQRAVSTTGQKKRKNPNLHNGRI